MKIFRAFYANIAVIQYTFHFNKEHETEIKAYSEHLEGVPFVTIDFGDLNAELVFKFSFRLGEIHKEVQLKNDFLLDMEQYPLPPKEDKNYKY
ncbi:hypothetical protein LVD15_04145 [Fulvivirga maritima]|uniref:hypothetical protein n=1 Tax=Fulvivirga maritima TaxID=2904247 RepID=UPI001F352BBE|nr:hypothetical protein [Fulvivirga maritima]UII27625.1 hypothetical protein LVD15_04145 [Fulvivirga maritima]